MFTQRLVDQLAGVKNIVKENTAKLEKILDRNFKELSQ